MALANDVTILVNSCDKYEDAWEPFFKLFSIQWPDCPYKIILNTESKNFSCDYLSVETIHTGDCKTWTERIKATLKKIDTEFVLFMLEDFFLLSPVNISAWADAIGYMQVHKSIGFIGLPDIKSYHPQAHKKKIDTFLYLTKKHAAFRVNASMGIWRKEFLLQMLFRDGDPWFFEWIAPKLSRYSKFQATCWNQKDCQMFNYEIKPEAGYGIVRGKWLHKNIELFASHNIQVNFDNLGFTSTKDAIASIGEGKKPKNRYIKRIKKRLQHIKSRFNDTKRFVKLYPAFKKYCKNTHEQLSSSVSKEN